MLRAPKPSAGATLAAPAFAASRAELAVRPRRSGEVFSFTIARNPWSRVSYFCHILSRGCTKCGCTHFVPPGRVCHSQVISAYVGKVADDNHTSAPYHSLARMRTWYGLGSAASVSFSQFVRWLGRDKTDDNAHWRPHSRQCAPSSHPYSFVARAETLEADLRTLTRRVGLSESLVVAEHISSASKCRMSARCAAALNRQVGPDWATLRSEEVLARIYRSDPAHDLRSAVRRAFAADVKAQNYTFPGSGKRKRVNR